SSTHSSPRCPGTKRRPPAPGRSAARSHAERQRGSAWLRLAGQAWHHRRVGRTALPPLLWRRGLGRGGRSPLSALRFPPTVQRVVEPNPAHCLTTAASSACPTPPEEEREAAPQAVSTEMRVRCRLRRREGRRAGETPA